MYPLSHSGKIKNMLLLKEVYRESKSNRTNNFLTGIFPNNKKERQALISVTCKAPLRGALHVFVTTG
jgi:hypothetical protein